MEVVVGVVVAVVVAVVVMVVVDHPKQAKVSTSLVIDSLYSTTPSRVVTLWFHLHWPNHGSSSGLDHYAV